MVPSIISWTDGWKKRVENPPAPGVYQAEVLSPPVSMSVRQLVWWENNCWYYWPEGDNIPPERIVAWRERGDVGSHSTGS